MSKTKVNDKDYILGHSEEELERLAKLAEYYRKSTRNLLIAAGITKGMRVLDFGAGAGDSSMLVAGLVGESGEVIAVDRSAEALERARYRTAAKGIKNVTTLLGDENTLAEVFRANKVDAAVGRLVLFHQKDVSAVFCKIVESVRPGGVVVFQEIDAESDPWTKPALPLMSKVWGWMVQTFRVSGMPIDVGVQLIRAFDRAGIQAQHIVREGVIETGPDALGYAVYADAARTLLPAMQKLNIATPEEVQVETLASRLRDEAVASQAFFIPIHLIGAYGRIPA
jgi:ubiquinone/menaquinone biosynthesis C-methylase UbiE